MSGSGRSWNGRAAAIGFSPAAVTRHPKFRIPVGVFLYCNGILEDSTGCCYHHFQILALRLILRLSTPKTTIFSKRGRNNALIRPSGSHRDFSRRFWREVLFAKRRIRKWHLEKLKSVKIGEKSGKKYSSDQYKSRMRRHRIRGL